MAIEIRPASRDDINSIIECRAEFLLEITGQEMPDELRKTTVEYFENHINSDSLVCYIAAGNNKIISTVVLSIYQVIPKLNNSTGKTGYVYSVYTSKEYRGQGLAKELMNRAIEEAKSLGVQEIYLNSQVKAIPLYERLGFQCVDREMGLMLGSKE